MTMQQFFAVLIGVGTYRHHSAMDVPATARDAEAVAAVLRDPSYCGYPAGQVQVLADGTATREGVLAALDALARPDEDATVVLFYAGHGEYAADGNYCLTTHDTRKEGGRVVVGTGVSEQELLERLRTIRARRLLVVVNACHAGEVSPVLGGDEAPMGVQLPEKTAAALLATGSGRVIITACREGQVSYVGKGDLTLFTQALVDGLQGKGDAISNRGGFISAFDLYSHLYETLQAWVPQRVSAAARRRYGEAQEPELTVLKGVGPFAVARFRGATALGSFTAPDRPEVDAGLREVEPERSERLLNRLLQVQAGRDANTAGRDVTTAGRDNLTGARIEGGYTGRDRTERRSVVDFGSGGQFGDITIGDVAGQDIIKTGDISGSGIAIGRGAVGVGGATGDTAPRAELQTLLAQLSAELRRAPAGRAADAAAAEELARQVVEQATRGQPNRTLVTISAEGLRAAAQNLAAVLPTALPLATKIVETVRKLISNPV